MLCLEAVTALSFMITARRSGRFYTFIFHVGLDFVKNDTHIPNVIMHSSIVTGEFLALNLVLIFSGILSSL